VRGAKDAVEKANVESLELGWRYVYNI